METTHSHTCTYSVGHRKKTVETRKWGNLGLSTGPCDAGYRRASHGDDHLSPGERGRRGKNQTAGTRVFFFSFVSTISRPTRRPMRSLAGPRPPNYNSVRGVGTVHRAAPVGERGGVLRRRPHAVSRPCPCAEPAKPYSHTHTHCCTGHPCAGCGRRFTWERRAPKLSTADDATDAADCCSQPSRVCISMWSGAPRTSDDDQPGLPGPSDRHL